MQPAPPDALSRSILSDWLEEGGPLDRRISASARAQRWSPAVSHAVWAQTDAVARFGLAVCAERWPEAWARWDRPESAMGALRRLSWSQLRAGVDAHARAAASGRPVPVVGGPADWARAHGVPVWWVAPLHAAWGDALPAFLEAQRRRPPLWVRLTRPDAAASLAAEGFSVRPDGSGAAVVVGSRPIHGTAAWRAGAMEVQDRASQEVGAQVPIAPGDRVWDACAGEGGKAMQLAARLGGRGALLATDVSASKLALLARRAARAGLQNVRVHAWDARERLPLPREAPRGFAAVLVDAPCSSSGTWRRNPDARWTVGPDRLAELPAVQGALLEAAAYAVAPGGALVYATCSWLDAEDDGVVADFLAHHPGWRRVGGGRFGAPVHDSDTLFAAVLRAPVSGQSAP